MANTVNLDLILPALSDETHQTILDLASNFNKIDDVSEIYRASYPTSGYWKKAKRIWNNDPQPSGFMGWVTIREGQAATPWEKHKHYQVGDQILSIGNNGHYYTCTRAGRTGSIEPSFLTSSASKTNDSQGATTWQPSRTYNVDDMVFPSIPINRVYICTTAGQSGTSQPAWPTVADEAINDGAAVWRCHIIVEWTESGTSALFKEFGAISS